MSCNDVGSRQQGMGGSKCEVDGVYDSVVWDAYHAYLRGAPVGGAVTVAEFLGVGRFGVRGKVRVEGGDSGLGWNDYGHVGGACVLCAKSHSNLAAVVGVETAVDGGASGTVRVPLGNVPDVGGVSAVCVDSKEGDGSSLSEVVDGRGKNWARNRAWKAEKKRKRDLKKVPQWRVGAAPLSPPSTVVTVDSRTAEEIEAAKTLAVRRTFENRLAVARAKYQLSSFADKEKTEAIRRLEVARLEEKFNTTKAKSQASYKKCASPLDSVGSAGSAGEFAWKQEIRKRDALKVERDYLEKQLEKAMLYLPEEGKRAIAEMPEPYIPSDEDIAAEDADICPFLSYEEMEIEAEKFIGAGVRW